MNMPMNIVHRQGHAHGCVLTNMIIGVSTTLESFMHVRSWLATHGGFQRCHWQGGAAQDTCNSSQSSRNDSQSRLVHLHSVRQVDIVLTHRAAGRAQPTCDGLPSMCLLTLRACISAVPAPGASSCTTASPIPTILPTRATQPTQTTTAAAQATAVAAAEAASAVAHGLTAVATKGALAKPRNSL
jgi:hypothetical protein